MRNFSEFHGPSLSIFFALHKTGKVRRIYRGYVVEEREKERPDDRNQYLLHHSGGPVGYRRGHGVKTALMVARMGQSMRVMRKVHAVSGTHQTKGQGKIYLHPKKNGDRTRKTVVRLAGDAALESHVHVLTDQFPHFRQQAAQHLGRLRDKRAAVALIEALLNCSTMNPFTFAVARPYALKIRRCESSSAPYSGTS
jgi:hypothetical protein